MTKEQTTILKGIAISMMLFLHLFSNQTLFIEENISSILWIKGVPLATILTRLCDPVDIFLLCSGYGLYYKYLSKKLSYNQGLKRIIRLYFNYWLILFIFVSLGLIFIPKLFPFNLNILLKNITGWDVNQYNHPAWFILPYSLLCITSQYIFKFIDSFGSKTILAISFVLAVFSMFIISRYIAPNNAHHDWYSIIFTYFDLLFAFILGAVICRKNKENNIINNWLYNNQKFVYLFIIMGGVVHCFIDLSPINLIFLIFFTYLYLHCKIKGLIKIILLKLGKKSMTMWLIHAFIYCSFFHDYIYGCKCPALIFIALLISSYILSIPIMWLSKHTIGRLNFLK